MRQTSIHVPACAVEALDRHRAAQGLSRDAAVRRLLAAHVERQLEVPASERLTHISTIMRHPLKPIHPGAGPDPRVRLSMRLPDELTSKARAIGLVLPGQFRNRAIGDYRARPLTDSVVTAIAAAVPMTDDTLAGLHPFVRQQAAVGLWRLAAAATMTSEEQRVLVETPASGDDQRVVEILREEDAAWHDQFRIQVVRFLVRCFLADGADQEQMLYDQRDGSEWATIRAEFEQFGLSDERFDAFIGWAYWNLDGRGASLLWRIRRKVELENISNWLFNFHPPVWPARDVDVPGWQLRVPDGWTAIPLADHRTAALDVGALVDTGQVLRLRTINPEREFLWPMLRDETGRPRPVPGLATVTAAIAAGRGRRRGGSPSTMQPAEIAEFLLLDHDALRVEMPVRVAQRAGLISGVEADDIVVAAQQATQKRMRAFITVLRSHLTAEHLHELESALDNPSQFIRIAWREPGLPPVLSDPFQSLVTTPTHENVVTSLAQEVVHGTAEPALTWLAKRFLGMYRSTLRTDRMKERQRGLDNNRHRPRWQGTDSRKKCDTEA